LLRFEARSGANPFSAVSRSNGPRTPSGVSATQTSAPRADADDEADAYFEAQPAFDPDGDIPADDWLGARPPAATRRRAPAVKAAPRLSVDEAIARIPESLRDQLSQQLGLRFRDVIGWSPDGTPPGSLLNG
jgi:hypothetical protein